MKPVKIYIFLSLLILSGCTKHIDVIEPPVTEIIPPAVPVKQKKTALILGGGGARGFAHIGVIRELEAADIPIDMIVGVSVGSLIGALYADTADTFKLEWKAFKIEKDEIFDFKIMNIWDGIVKGEAIKNYIDQNIENSLIEKMKIPLAIVAVDLNTGEPFVFKSGPVRDAVRASVSIPGVFEPFVLGNKLLVDGGVRGNLSPETAKNLGADIIIGVDIGKTRRGSSLIEKPNALNVILESVDIMGEEIIRSKKEQFDIIIKPDVGDIGIMDFSHKKELIEAGRKAAREAIPRIRELLN